MISFSGRTKIFAATEGVDLRKSYDALFAYCRDVIQRDPLSGHVFLFLNKSRDRLKALLWDGTGLVLICKRLEKGHFTRLNTLSGPTLEMTASEFALLFEGADLTKRFVESPPKYLEIPASFSCFIVGDRREIDDGHATRVFCQSRQRQQI